MIIESFVFDCGPLEVNHYLVANESTREGFLIDAGVFDESVTQFAERNNIQITAILLTHLHPDHVNAVRDYADRWKCPIFSPALASLAPEANLVFENDEIHVAGFDLKIFRTSGHTPESISYYCAREGVCFVGDAIFAGAVGGTNLDDLHEEEIGHLRRNILTLPPETELYSGHGPMTTVAIEAAANPFLQPGFTRLP